MATAVKKIKQGDTQERDINNSAAHKENKGIVKELFDSLVGPGDGAVKMEGVDLRDKEPAYREQLTPNERKEKQLLTKVLDRYSKQFESLQDKKSAPSKMRRQTLPQLREYFKPELDEHWVRLAELCEEGNEESIQVCFENIYTILDKIADAKEIDYDLLVRLEDEYMKKSP